MNIADNEAMADYLAERPEAEDANAHTHVLDVAGVQSFEELADLDARMRALGIPDEPPF